MLFLDAAGLASTTLRPMDSPAPGFFDSPVPGLSSLDLARRFADRFRNDPRIGARAPGRVNLIGEHTDYSEGLVLPFAIDRETLVLAGPGASSRVRVLACDLAAEGDFEPVFAGDLEPDREPDRDSRGARRRGDWLDYVRAVFAALAERGLEFGPVDLAISSRVPREAGLSSSAALCVGLVTALDALGGCGLDARERARVAHRAESHFVGLSCGILDPFASALAERDCALLIDCQSQATQRVRFDSTGAAVLVAHSGISRALARGDYRERVRECRRAEEALALQGGVDSLRDLAPADLPAVEAALDPLLFRRVRHVVSENERVSRVRNALERSDFFEVGVQLRAGHRSLAVDFEVSTPELDALCEIADSLPGVFGSRLTGAGFGGCTLHLVEPGAVPGVRRELARRFASRFGCDPHAFAVRPSAGASTFLPG
ncbi:MAG: galactokinase [Myxococcota bacterium]|jgi:galactokinase